MKYKLETITPAAAREFLKNNTHNRMVRDAWVNTLACEIANNRWETTHQGIAIAADGTIIDGQHRLLAIAQAGIAVEVYVARDVPMEIQVVTDTGSKRNVADFLNLNDKLGNANVKAAALRQIVSIACYYQNPCTTYGLIKYLYDEVGRELEFVVSAVHTFKPAMKGWVLGALTLAYAADRSVGPFIEAFGNGENLKHGDPAKAARDWLIASASRHLVGSYKRGAIEGLLNAAFNAAGGQRITTVKRGVQGADHFIAKRRKLISTIREQMRHQIETVTVEPVMATAAR
jgi:hypothetical protein